MREITRSDHIITRSIYSTVLNYEGNSALVIKGIRRCGKSTLLKQLILGKGSLSFFYFNFDDERIYGFSVEDFQTLMETFIETYGQAKNIFFDEIQNVNGWELFVNRLLREGNKVFVTGSNSNLLSKELGTHLTGRHVDLELYPFSFSEYLSS
ncbi:MAG: ATP-binding protein, partial [Thermoplasmataceae archaeon]